jgi:hypothetical protein
LKGQNSQPNSGVYVSSNLNWNRPKQLKRTPVPHTPEFAEKVNQRLFQGYKTDPEKVNDKPPMASHRTHSAVLKSSSEGTTAVSTTTFHASVNASKPKSNTKADRNVEVVDTKATVGRPDPLRTLLRTQVSMKQQPKSELLIKQSKTTVNDVIIPPQTSIITSKAQDQYPGKEKKRTRNRKHTHNQERQ